jgi:serine/threonine-protein kinase HipA
MSIRRWKLCALTKTAKSGRDIAFSVLITNLDGHQLNHGFLHVVRGLWRLAPAFGINPAPERVRELKT